MKNLRDRTPVFLKIRIGLGYQALQEMIYSVKVGEQIHMDGATFQGFSEALMEAEKVALAKFPFQFS